ncbi:MAG TPA: hypothetical protein PLD55_12510 [bacterium]|nr:hypothetical protein [bacterium]MDX9804976.1 hypothetical protein [bacterium]HNW16858.1 hypothetical protein [bacterium]HOG43798.1 hypothetical protein [bacterium]HPG35782.1 hypothetical protein [bacterium]
MIKRWIFLIFMLVFSVGCENSVNSLKNKSDDEKNDEKTVVDEENDPGVVQDEGAKEPDESEETPDEQVDENENQDVDFIWDNCSNTWDCEGDEMCVKEIGRCTDSWGKCEKIPEDCEAVDEPVCGCDGMSYANKCIAMQNAQNIKHNGVCETGLK